MTHHIALAEVDLDQIQLFPETPEIVFGLLAFVIVLGFMVYFVFPKLNEVLDARTNAIQGKIDEANKTLEAAQAEKASYDTKLAGADVEATTILDNARQDAETMRLQLVNTAKQEAEQIRAEAATQAATEKARVMVEASEQVGALSVEIAAHIVEQEIDEKRHHALVSEFIDGLTK